MGNTMTIHYEDDTITLHLGDSLDVLRGMPDQSVDCCVTSPPYFGLRDYGVQGQYGLEASPAEYVETMRALFGEVARVLAHDGTLWLNIGDSYAATGTTMTGTASMRQRLNNSHERNKTITRGAAGIPAKNLMGIPWRVAFALQDDGWILRNDIIWHKPNAMPESVTDRLSTRYEHVFLFSKNRRYWFDLDPIREPHTTELIPQPMGRRVQSWTAGTGIGQPQQGNINGVGKSDAGKNPGDVWSINTQPFSAAHFAVMPTALAERCIQAGCKPGGTVLDPFSGSGTTGLAAGKHGRRYVGIDLNPEYLDLSLRTRLAQTTLIGDAS